MLAVMKGHEDVVEYLYEKGADITLQDFVSYFYHYFLYNLFNNALYVCFFADSLERLRYL